MRFVLYFVSDSHRDDRHPFLFPLIVKFSDLTAYYIWALVGLASFEVDWAFSSWYCVGKFSSC